ncbi:hypothetical protein NC652_022166 [Populus alba x Populus x berolinensis]|nr:hypothetical protein NC652_022166 [Populus alba x Populus x berolinensis]
MRKNILHIIARLSLSTTIYYIWFERNNKIFTTTFHPPQHTSVEIIQHVKYGTCALNVMVRVLRFY